MATIYQCKETPNKENETSNLQISLNYCTFAQDMQNKIRNIFLIIGVVAVIIMCFTFDVSFATLWHEMLRAGYWLITILALWGLLYAMNAISWLIIIRGSGNCPVSYRYLLKLTITGFALNYATPVGLLGGEPYKIMEMTPHIGAQRATSSVVLFSMMHVFSHFCYWVTAIIAYIIIAAMGLLPLNPAIALLLMLMLSFCGLGIYLFLQGYKNGLIVKLISWIGHVPGLKKWVKRFATEHDDDLRKIDQQIAELHSQEKSCFYASFGMEYLGRMMQSLEIFFILLIFESAPTLLNFMFAFLILAFTSLFANLLFFFPLQLGGREGGFAMSTAQMGLSTDVGMFISLICRVRELFWTAIGLALIKIGGKSQGNR